MPITILFILAAMLAGDLLWWRAARRQLGDARWARRAADAFAVTMLAGLVAIIAGRFVGSRGEWLPTPILVGIFVWHFLGLSIALLLATLRGTARGVAALVPRPAERPDEPIAVDDASPLQLSRRAFLGRTSAALPALVSVGASGVALGQLDAFRVRRLDVPLADLPSGLDGLTIAHVSDVHLGSFTTAQTFRRIVAATNDLDADLVLHTGDLINFDQRDLPAATQLVREMRGRHGQFLCEGNHDLIQGRAGFVEFMRGAGMPLLSDALAGLRIGRVDVEILGLGWTRPAAGSTVDDALAASVSRLAARRSPGAFPILLAHHPHAFDAAVAAGVPLTLSGHTHGGQLALARRVGFGPLMYRYWSGPYARGGRAAIVSNGVGNWFPLRVGAPAEILHLTLRRA